MTGTKKSVLFRGLAMVALMFGIFAAGGLLGWYVRGIVAVFPLQQQATERREVPADDLRTAESIRLLLDQFERMRLQEEDNQDDPKPYRTHGGII